MALANLAVFGGSFFTPILVGKITHTIGWPWSFYFVTIFAGVCLPLVFFSVPETAYRRPAIFNLDLASSDDVRPLQASGTPGGTSRIATASSDEKSSPTENDNKAISNRDHAHNYDTSDQERHDSGEDALHSAPQTFKENLRLFSGRKTDDILWKLILRPFPLFAQPAIFW